MISRAIVDMFSDRELAGSLAFRGGTALYKIHLNLPARYSEDIDLVQMRPEPIGGVLDRIRSVLDGWLGEPRRQFKEGRVNLIYRFESEDVPPQKLRLKIEINTREHFSALGLLSVPYSVNSPWFKGAADVPTYTLEELLATKLRSLYQRKKGRDLFDLWYAQGKTEVDPSRLLFCFDRYMGSENVSVTRAMFEENLDQKRSSADFRDDVKPLLRPDLVWDTDEAMEWVRDNLVAKLPGDPWKGGE